MLRKTTDLEKKLLNKGFKLVFKTYKDTKSSKRIESYAYKGEVNNYECYIYLNSKRNEVKNFVIANKGSSNLVSRDELYDLETTFHDLEDICYGETPILTEDKGVELPLDIDKKEPITEEEVENDTYEGWVSY